MSIQIDNLDFSERGDPVQVTVPTIYVSALVTDETSAVIADYTGANRLQFPRDFGTLSVELQQLLLLRIVEEFVRSKAGVTV